MTTACRMSPHELRLGPGGHRNAREAESADEVPVVLLEVAERPCGLAAAVPAERAEEQYLEGGRLDPVDVLRIGAHRSGLRHLLEIGEGILHCARLPGHCAGSEVDDPLLESVGDPVGDRL